MPLSIIDYDEHDALSCDEWHFPARPFFQRSHAYEILKRELRRYLRGEVAGRSFLIAGHRGAGKTSVVTRAVEDLYREVMGEARAEAAYFSGITLRQRPFPVKLHGSGLLSPARREDNNLLGLVSETPIATSTPSAEAALQQLTIALYRAFAREVANAFTMHARRDLRPGIAELAGQLTLDLDQAPDIAALRAAWARLGRIDAGVLWPSSYGGALVARGFKDRGIREILALVTANHAFQVCSGRIESSQFSKGSASREASVKVESKVDAKDIINKLWGLGAGALVGGSLLTASNATTAVVGGLAAGLLSTFALSWSGARAQRREQGVDYTFIVDRSIQTLERDLPLVIDRIREAGLAPVFIIDELDKIDAPVESIKAIIDRLKNLTTDYGFFCFLTDRDYYEEIQRKIQTEAFPGEHTYFSHRLMVVYQPEELAHFVRPILKSDSPGDRTDETGAWVLTSCILHRARLNTVDVVRAIAQLSDERGSLRSSGSRVVGGREYLVPMAMQLAIEHVLRSAILRLRVENESTFAQLALDTLYMISRAWDEEKESIVIERDNIYKYLFERRHIFGKNDKERQERFEQMVNTYDIGILEKASLDLANLLLSFDNLRTTLEAEFHSSATAAPGSSVEIVGAERTKMGVLMECLTTITGTGLLKKVSDSKFEFVLDVYGLPRELTKRVEQAAAAAAQGGGGDDASSTVMDEIKGGLRFFDNFKTAMDQFDITLDKLIALGVLPVATAPELIEASASRLRDPNFLSAEARTVTDDLSNLADFERTIRLWSRAIAVIIALAERVRADALKLQARIAMHDALLALDRFVGIRAMAALVSGVGNPGEAIHPLKAPQSSIAGFLRRLAARPSRDYLGKRSWPQSIARQRQRVLFLGAEVREDRDAGEARAWDEWRLRILRWLKGPPAALDPPISYHDVVSIAAGMVNGVVLRPELDEVSISDWSRFCVGTVLPGAKPSWGPMAALSALGFGYRQFRSIPGWEPELATVTGDTRAGILLVCGETASLGDRPPVRSGLPVFAVSQGMEHAVLNLLINDLKMEGGIADIVLEVEPDAIDRRPSITPFLDDLPVLRLAKGMPPTTDLQTPLQDIAFGITSIEALTQEVELRRSARSQVTPKVA